MTASPIPKPLPVRLVSGVIYSPLERRARVQGAGLEVWEILNVYRSVGSDFERLQRSFDWLTPTQLRAALAFSEQNPAFVAAELTEADAAPQRLRMLWDNYPFTRPSEGQ